MRIANNFSNQQNRNSQTAFKAKFKYTDGFINYMITNAKPHETEFLKEFKSPVIEQKINAIEIDGQEPLLEVKKRFLGGFKVTATLGKFKRSQPIDPNIYIGSDVYKRGTTTSFDLAHDIVQAMRGAAYKISVSSQYLKATLLK